MDPLSTALLGIITSGVVGFCAALVRGDFVMGWMYRQERKDRLQAEKALAILTRAAKKLPVKLSDDAGGDR